MGPWISAGTEAIEVHPSLSWRRSAAGRSPVRCNPGMGSVLGVLASMLGGRCGGAEPASPQVRRAMKSVPIRTPSCLEQYLELGGKPLTSPGAGQGEDLLRR